MAYSAPSTRSAGALITAAIWNQDVVANPIAIYSGAMAMTSQAADADIYASSATQLAVATTGRQLRQSFRGLHLGTSPDADLAATTVTMRRCLEIVCSNGVRRTPADNLTATITTAGINGLRASQSEAASTWYKIMYAYGGSGEGLYLEQALDHFLDESFTTTDSVATLRGGAATTKLGQSFDTDTTGYVPYVDIPLAKVGSPTGRVWMELYATSGGVPTGAVLATSDKLDVSLLSTSSLWIRFPFRTPVLLTAGTMYAVVGAGDYAVSGANYVTWLRDSAAGYGAGTRLNYDGATWTTEAQDMNFKVYVTRNNNTVTPPSGYDTGYAQIGWVYNDASSNFREFLAFDKTVRQSSVTLVSGGAATVLTLIDAASAVPPTLVVINSGALGSGAGNIYLDGRYSSAYQQTGWRLSLSASTDGISSGLSASSELQHIYYAVETMANGTIYARGFTW